MERSASGGFSGTALKIIAAASMLIDHIGAVLIEGGNLTRGVNVALSGLISFPSQPIWWKADFILRLIGRIAFPIFAFLLVEGFLHTRDVRRYGARLLIFGFLSEIPFDLAVFHTPFYLDYQNVFFTLFFALLALCGIRRWEDKGVLWKQVAAASLCCCFASLLKTDYGAFGVGFVVLLYITREDPRMQAAAGSLAIIWELTAVLAFIPIGMYNKTRGKGKFKYSFYAFYPLHLLFLYGMWRLLFL